MKTNIGKDQDQETKVVETEASRAEEISKNEDMQELISKLVAQEIAKRSDEGNLEEVTDREELQMDLLPHPRYLIARSAWYQIQGYSIHGKEFLPPHGKITFNSSSFRYMEGKTQISYCVAEIGRKSVWEYIEDHPHYGTIFHERKSQVFSGSIETVDKVAQALIALAALDPVKLERKAEYYKNKGYDIDMSVDHRDIMRQLAQIQGQEMQAASQNRMSDAVKKSMGDFQDMQGRASEGVLQSAV